jgi:hypothetical protein
MSTLACNVCWCSFIGQKYKSHKGRTKTILKASEEISMEINSVYRGVEQNNGNTTDTVHTWSKKKTNFLFKTFTDKLTT